MADPSSSSSSTFSTSYSFSRPDLDLSQWVDSIRRSINVDHDDKTTNTKVCIFSVPKILLDTDPYSYIPQLVALGPIHQWHPNVYDMQKYKLAAAKITQNRRNVKFERIVDIIKSNDEARIRACYHKFLDVDSDTLAWMMAVDMAFLLEFLRVSYGKELDAQMLEIASRLLSVIDVSRRKLSHRMILRDVVKLENQIPLFLIKTMLEHDHNHQNSDRSAKETLQNMLMGLYDELSPFQYRHKTPTVDVDECNHLLAFLYHMTIPNHKELGITGDEVQVDTTTFDGVDDATGAYDGGKEESFSKPSNLKQALRFIWKIITRTNFAFARFLKKIIFSKPITLLLKLPWAIISRLPLLRLLKEPVENMMSNFIGQKIDQGLEDGNTQQPLVAEIEIPSVSQMVKAGIVFSPVHDTISGLRFDEKTSTLYLPVLDLDGNTKVYLRNLVAYEACIANGPLVMARYTELMNGIIDTAKDAKILMDHKIILNSLKTDKEAADLWNGMSKCAKTTMVPSLDKVIEQVNKRYHQTWSVKLAKFMNKYVFGSWRFLTFLAAVFLLLLSTVQTFCSVYTCARVIKQLPPLDQPE